MSQNHQIYKQNIFESSISRKGDYTILYTNPMESVTLTGVIK